MAFATHLQGEFDWVVINSVVQYFANGAYLEQLLRQVRRLLSPNGRVFIGDVRHHGLSRLHYLNILCHQWPDEQNIEVTCAQVRYKLAQLQHNDPELLVSPEFLVQQAQKLGFAGIRMQPKGGLADNEMTSFRYDVTLSLVAELVEPQKLACTGAVEAQVRAHFANSDRPLLLTGVTNARTEGLYQAALLLSEQSSANRFFDVSEVDFNQGDRPEEVVQRLKDGGFYACPLWSGSVEDGAFDVLVHQRDLADGPWLAPASVVPEQATISAPFVQAGALVDSLAKQLAAGLPEYMIPEQILLTPAIALTTHGKVDHQAMRWPGQIRLASVKDDNLNYSQMQAIMSGVWSKILNRPVAIADNLFQCGANSLKVIEASIALVTLGIKVSPADIFQYQSIEALSVVGETTLNKVLEADLAALSPMQYVPAEAATGQDILLTGATGFLGIYVLRELLQSATHQGKTITCLVRSDDGAQRLAQTWRSFFSQSDAFDSRVKVIKGDVGVERFGLSESDYHSLSVAVSTIYHVAADVRHVAFSERIYQTNMVGTETLLKFCFNLSQKKLNYVSTIGVKGLYMAQPQASQYDESDFDLGQAFKNHYSRSKFLAEYRVREAMNCGLDATIYRVGTIAGDSTNGQFQKNAKDHFLVRFIASCIHLGTGPLLEKKSLALNPVDVLAKAILSLSVNESEHGKRHTYHLESLHKISYGELLQSLVDYGYDIKLTSLEAFRHHCIDNMDKPSVMNQLGGVMSKLVAGGFYSIPLNSEVTNQALAALDIEFAAPQQAQMGRFIDHCVNVGVLPKP